MAIADILSALTSNFGIPRDWDPATPIGKFVKGSQGPQAALAMALMGGPKLPGPRLMPAVRFGNEMFTGQNHGIAYANAEAAGRIYGPAKEGFVTPEGQFLDRAQALKFATESGQVAGKPDWDKRLATEDINPGAYNQ